MFGQHLKTMFGFILFSQFTVSNLDAALRFAWYVMHDLVLKLQLSKINR